MVGEEECETPVTNVIAETNLIDNSKIPEMFRSVPMKEVCVFVDPLDATKEYTLGNLAAVCCLIGIAFKGEAVAGVMYQPFVEINGQGRLVYGMVGMGAVGVSPPPRPGNKLRVTVTRTHGSEQLDLILKKLNPDEVIRTGGAGYKMLLLLDGTADVYFHIAGGTKKWDTAAGEAILRAVGGGLTDLEGKKLEYTTTAPKSNDVGLICSLFNLRHYVNLVYRAEDEALPSEHNLSDLSKRYKHAVLRIEELEQRVSDLEKEKKWRYFILKFYCLD